MKASRRMVLSRGPLRGGLGAEKRLTPAENRRAKLQTSAAQRLATRKPQNRLEKNKPLGRLDLRRFSRAAGPARTRRRGLGETTQTTLSKQLATRNRAFFGPEGGVEKNTSPAASVAINGLNTRE